MGVDVGVGGVCVGGGVCSMSVSVVIPSSLNPLLFAFFLSFLPFLKFYLSFHFIYDDDDVDDDDNDGD